MINWRPTAEISTLFQRAEFIKNIRAFFYSRNFLEVETPILSQHTVTDPFLASFSTDQFFLQTSPEYHMKRLLAAGSGPIFQITKAFRQDEAGTRHNPEFTMLEWYRPGYTHHQLMDEMDDLLILLLQTEQAIRMTYQAAFEQHLAINPLIASISELKNCAETHGIQLSYNQIDSNNMPKDTWLDLLMSHCIEPHLGKLTPVFIYNYPASQAALSVTHDNIGERFEVYYQGIELANGFHELTDATEQRRRFEKNLTQRRRSQLPELSLDEYFLAALENGFPASSGVALGLDRLIMLALNKKNIQEVMSFSIHNA